MIVAAVILVALILAPVDEFRARGESLTGWAVVLIAIALLIGRL